MKKSMEEVFKEKVLIVDAEKCTGCKVCELICSVTGIDMDENKLLTAGERIVNLEKAFNIREGWTRKDDTLPQRVLTEPYPDGPAKGQVVQLEPMLEEY
jgi:aldehyde:ferredoxin oxidoreductase